MGWKLVGNIPKDVKKAVLVCAPHTSNWDFPLALASFQVAGLNLKYFIKKSWFFFPMNLFFRATGGVPVNRSKNVGLVEAMALQLKNADEMILAVPAEGTRSWVPKWKTGFYYIAKGANVPIVMATLDFGNKKIKISKPYYTTSDKDKDFEYFSTFFKNVKGKNPELF